MPLLFCLPFANRAFDPVIFISISTEINSSFQWRTWFAKLSPGSIFSFRSTHMHCISHPAYHAMFCIMLLAHCTVVDHGSLCLCSCFGLSREMSTWTRNPLSTLTRIKLTSTRWTLQARWPYPRNHFYLCLLVARSIAMPMPRYLPLALSCLPYCHVKPLTHLVLANRCLAMLPLCSAPLIALLVAGEDWSLFLVGTCLLLGYHYYILSTWMHLYTW